MSGISRQMHLRSIPIPANRKITFLPGGRALASPSRWGIYGSFEFRSQREPLFCLAKWVSFFGGVISPSVPGTEMIYLAEPRHLEDTDLFLWPRRRSFGSKKISTTSSSSENSSQAN